MAPWCRITVRAVVDRPSLRTSGVSYTVAGRVASHDVRRSMDSGVLGRFDEVMDAGAILRLPEQRSERSAMPCLR